MKKSISQQILRLINELYNAISHPYALVITVLIIIVWFIVGVPMNYNDLWYKSLHTFELLVTLVLVFIIEVTQKAEMRALQEKLDEIIKKHPKTSNRKVGIEKKYKGKR
ncbi:MAG TPA: low affinity iron permease family protein [Candidatus Saccharimonadales bacterium]|nr:low affinity iron permease family protein [Candidatus Saccharimonadales bacterium]